jgi:hypothetical protein
VLLENSEPRDSSSDLIPAIFVQPGNPAVVPVIIYCQVVVIVRKSRNTIVL